MICVVPRTLIIAFYFIYFMQNARSLRSHLATQYRSIRRIVFRSLSDQAGMTTPSPLIDNMLEVLSKIEMVNNFCFSIPVSVDCVLNLTKSICLLPPSLLLTQRLRHSLAEILRDHSYVLLAKQSQHLIFRSCTTTAIASLVSVALPSPVGFACDE